MIDGAHVGIKVEILKKKDASLYLLDVNCQVCFQLNQKKKKTDIPIDHKLDEIS